MRAIKLPHLPALIHWSNLLLGVLLAVSLAQLTWRLMPTPSLPQPATAPPAAATNAESGLRLREIAGLHLFGTPTQGAVPTAPIRAPDTPLNLSLRGLAATGEGGTSLAIIADAQGEEKPYRIGDQLPGGAVLAEIRPDRVILRRSGRYEALRLPREALEESGAASAQPTATPSSAAAAKPSLAQLRSQLRSNPQNLGQYVRLEPVMEAGRVKGYRLTPLKDERLFREAGLKPGDVITAINGITLGNPARLGEVMAQLSSAQQLSLRVERNGHQESVSVSLGR